MFKICPSCEIHVHKALRKCTGCGFEWTAEECVYATKLPDLKDVTFKAKEPTWYDIEGTYLDIHENKKTNKRLGQVIIRYKKTAYKFSYCSMWLCLPDYYEGYAVTMAKKKWKTISDAPFPKTVEKFKEASVNQICRVLLDESNKYCEIVKTEGLPF